MGPHLFLHGPHAPRQARAVVMRGSVRSKDIIILTPVQLKLWRYHHIKPRRPDGGVQQPLIRLSNMDGQIVRTRLPHTLPVMMNPATKASILKSFKFKDKLQARLTRFNVWATGNANANENTLNNPCQIADTEVKGEEEDTEEEDAAGSQLLKEEEDAVDYDPPPELETLQRR